MKNIFLVVFALFVSLISKGQANSQTMGNDSTVVTIKSIAKGNKGLIPGIFADTAAANSWGRVKTFQGLIIFTTGDNKTWIRNTAANAWLELASSAGTITALTNGLTLTGSTGKLGGTLTQNTTISGNNLYNTAFDAVSSFRAEANTGTGKISSVLVGTDSILFQPSDAIFIIDSLPSGASTDSVLVWTQATGRVKKRSYSSFTPTWQQTLTAGSTINQDNTIAGGGNSILWNGFNDFEVLSSGAQLFKADFGGYSAQVGITQGLSVTIGTYDVGIPGHNSALEIYADSIGASPYSGRYAIDTLNNLSNQNTLLGRVNNISAPNGNGHGNIGYVTLGSGLSLSSGILNTSGTVPTPISSLTAATGTNDINNLGYAQTWRWNSKNTYGLQIMSTTTSDASSQALLHVELDGANASPNITSFGFNSSIGHTGTNSTNIAGRFQATGGTNNYAIIVPASSGSVGIGTSTPTEILHVVGNIKGTNYIELTDVSAPSTPSSGFGRIYVRADSLRFKNDGGTEFTMGTGGGITGSGTANQVTYWNGSSSITGDAGFTRLTNEINLTQSSAGVDVAFRAKNTSTSGGYTTAAMIVENSSSFGELFKSGTGYAGYKTIAATDLGFYNTGGNISILNDYASGNINFSAGGNSTAAMTINTSNNVGIGTTSPASPLQVKGTGSSTGAWKGRIVAGGDNVAFLMGEYNSQAWLGAHNAALSAWASIYINPDGGAATYFGPTATPVMIVSNTGTSVETRGNTYLAATTGSVGIGTTSPTYKLDVTGTANFSTSASSALFKAADGSSGSPSYTFTSNTATGLIAFNGVSAAGDELKAVANNLGAGFAVQNNNASGYSGIEYFNNAGALAVFTGYNNGSAGEFRFNNVAASANIVFKIASVDKLKIFNSGNIGVGGYTTDDVNLGISGTLKSTTSAYFATSSGSVGIGTTSPSAKLHVISTTEQLRIGYDASNYMTATVGSTGTTTLVSVGSASKIVIGSSTEFQVLNAATDAGATHFNESSTGNNYIRHATGGFTTIQTNSGSTEVARFTGGANVGIGTGATVSAKLHVISTTEQFRSGYDASNYWNATTGSTGGTTFNAVGTGSAFNFSDRVAHAQGADVASVAGAISLGTDGNLFEITGTNSITLISNVGWQNGSEVTLMFTSTATLVNGTATSGTDVTILLAGAANFTGSANDVITLVYGEIGGTVAWREKSRSVN